MLYGAYDDICLISKKPIYLYNAKDMFEIAEYIISGISFETQREIYNEPYEYIYCLEDSDSE